MRLRYGNYLSAVGEANVSITRQMLETEAGVPYECVHTWGIQGRLFGDTPAGLAVVIAAVEIAFSRWFQTAQLIGSDGTVWHQLANAGSTTGVKVQAPPSYPDGSGGQLTTYRDYTVTLVAHYPAAAGKPLIRSWQETLTFTGGRPDRRVVETLNTAPLAYIGRRRTAFRCTQSGSAVGYLGYPPIPAPLFGDGLLEGGDHPVGYGAPRTQDGRLVDWPVNWSYRFASAVPLVGLPNILPSG